MDGRCKMKKIVFAITVIALFFCSFSPAFAGDGVYPYLGVDLYFHALFVHQENFAASTGIFGSSINAASGNFNEDVDNDYDSLIESRFRFFLTGYMTEWASGRFTLEINPEYGHEQGFGDFRVNNGDSGSGELRIKHFYIDVHHDVGGTLGYRVGRQSFSSPKSLIVGDPDAEGLTLYYKNRKTGKFTLAGAAADTSQNQEVEDIYAHLRYDSPTFASSTNLSVYGSTLIIRDKTVDKNNSAPEINNGGRSGIGEFLMGESGSDRSSGTYANIYWVGIEGKRKDGDFEVQLDGVVSFGTIERGRRPDYSEDYEPEEEDESNIDEILGYMAMLDASYGRSFYRFGVAGAYVSGHNPDPDATVYTGYVDANASFTFTRFFFCGGPYIQSSGFCSPSVQGSGLIGAKFYLYTNPTYWLSLNAQVATLTAAKDRPRLESEDNEYRSYDENAGKYYGTEIDFWAVFTPVERVNWLVEVDYFHPGTYWAGTQDNDSRGNGFLRSLDPAWRVSTGFLFR